MLLFRKREIDVTKTIGETSFDVHGSDETYPCANGLAAVDTLGRSQVVDSCSLGHVAIVDEHVADLPPVWRVHTVRARSRRV